MQRPSVSRTVLPCVAMVGYALLWLGYRQSWDALDGMDSWTLGAAYDIGVKHPGWVRFWDAVCTVFAPAAFRLLGMVAAVVALLKHRLPITLFLLVSIEFSGLLTQTAKDLADRPRPATALVAAASTSFPSGHALGAMVGVVALLTVTLPVLGSRMRLPAVAAGALIVLAVGCGRVALNVHHPSDVLAGWALGYLYVALCQRLILTSMKEAAAAVPDPIDRIICSRKGCTAAATWGMLWNNPKVHTPQRRKVWLTCDEHRQYFRDYLGSRNFLKHEVPVEELERTPEV